MKSHWKRWVSRSVVLTGVDEMDRIIEPDGAAPGGQGRDLLVRQVAGDAAEGAAVGMRGDHGSVEEAL